jgi:hypothetical protein
MYYLTVYSNGGNDLISEAIGNIYLFGTALADE